MTNTKLRIIWIIPNLFCYLMLVGFSTWIVINVKALQEINELLIYVLFMFLLFIVSVYGSIRIRSWIKEGKI